MGGVVSNLFGGGSSKSASNSNSYNQAYNYLNGALSPSVAAGTGATTALSGLLTGDNGESSAAFQNYLGSTGYKQAEAAGEGAIKNSAATTGTLNSGATLKALQTYGQNSMGAQYQNYLGDLSNLAGIGNTAASTIAGAGQTSTSSSTGKASNTSGIIPGLFG